MVLLERFACGLARYSCFPGTVATPFKKNEEAQQIKVDSYVLETNVHFPTDLNLAWDAARKIIDLISLLRLLLGELEDCDTVNQ